MGSTMKNRWDSSFEFWVLADRNMGFTMKNMKGMKGYPSPTQNTAPPLGCHSKYEIRWAAKTLNCTP